MNSSFNKALRLFHSTAERVPAYKDFLRRERVNPSRIKTAKDFAAVPTTDAKNYIAAYPLAKRCWDGRLSNAQLIATSSGTTGEPKFWPRNAGQDIEAAVVHRELYRMYFQTHRRSTLLLIGFPMGIYVSGMAETLSSWLMAPKNPRLTIVSIGNNKTEMLRAVRHLSGSYDQTILVGHPFFIKDVIETGGEEGIPWSPKNLGLMFCSEGFSESWREYIRKKARIPKSSSRIFNTYGSSEMLLMGYETPFSISIKQLFEKDGRMCKAVTGDQLPPQVFQYHPSLRYIESVNHELIFTAASGIPLIRYNLKDRGEVLGLEEIAAMLPRGAVKPKWRLPLVTLSGRSDQTIVFYAANIYPEHIKAGLQVSDFFKELTGKFTMRKEYQKNMDEFLEINIELKPGVKPSSGLAAKIRDQIVKKLELVNLEYDFLRKNLDKDIVPRIKLFPNGHTKYFKPGVKPRYLSLT